jgi:hypothetical protein
MQVAALERRKNKGKKWADGKKTFSANGRITSMHIVI